MYYYYYYYFFSSSSSSSSSSSFKDFERERESMSWGRDGGRGRERISGRLYTECRARLRASSRNRGMMT